MWLRPRPAAVRLWSDHRGRAQAGSACHTGPMPDTRCVVVLAGTALLGIGLDQATKALVVATIEDKPPIHLVGQVLTVAVSRNSGAAFSFAPAATVLFTCLAVAIAVLIVTKVPRLRSPGWAAALGLLLAGAVGNLCDRLLRAPGIGRGAVVASLREGECPREPKLLCEWRKSGLARTLALPDLGFETASARRPYLH